MGKAIFISAVVTLVACDEQRPSPEPGASYSGEFEDAIG
jgi:hypothetical protein